MWNYKLPKSGTYSYKVLKENTEKFIMDLTKRYSHVNITISTKSHNDKDYNKIIVDIENEKTG